MTQTTYNDVNAVNKMVQSFWAPIFMDELRESTLWPNLIKSHYEVFTQPNGTQVPIVGGANLYINEIQKNSPTIKTIGTDADTFESNQLKSKQVTLTVSKRAMSAYEFEDLAVLMSQLNDKDSDIRNTMLAEIRVQINDYIKSLISASTTTPDHDLSSVTDFTMSQLTTIRNLASTAKWFSSPEPKITVLSPTYYGQLIDELGSASVDYTDDRPYVSGRIMQPRLGFTIIEDDSLTGYAGYSFMPSFMIGAFGTPQFEVASLAAQKKKGFVIVCDQVCGAVQYDNKRVIYTH